MRYEPADTASERVHQKLSAEAYFATGIAPIGVHYGEMCIEDTAAMNGYASSSAPPALFSPPQQTANASGLAGQAVASRTQPATATNTGTVSLTGQHTVSVVPQALQVLASPASPTVLTSNAAGLLHGVFRSSAMSYSSLLGSDTAATRTASLGSTSAHVQPVGPGRKQPVSPTTAGNSTRCEDLRAAQRPLLSQLKQTGAMQGWRDEAALAGPQECVVRHQPPTWPLPRWPEGVVGDAAFTGRSGTGMTVTSCSTDTVPFTHRNPSPQGGLLP